MMLSDIGSGLSTSRKQLTRLLEMVCEDRVGEVAIMYADRLTRFGQAYLECLFPRDAHVGLHHPQGKRVEEEKMLRQQRSRAYCVSEPDHETDLGGRRNHPLLRWRVKFRQQHARCESSFQPIQAGASFTQKEEEHRSSGMEILYTNCAGLDVHKKTVKVCVLTHTSNGQLQKEFRTYFTTTEELLKLGDWLKEQGCTHIAFEATGVYWKPVFNLLESSFEVLVVNAQHIKAVPGRKTDVKDAEWIADLLQHGLLKASFIPSSPQRELRDLTRYRVRLTEEKAREINRVQKTLEDTNLKLGDV